MPFREKSQGKWMVSYTDFKLNWKNKTKQDTWNQKTDPSWCDSSEREMGLKKLADQASLKVDNVLLLIVTPTRPDM